MPSASASDPDLTSPDLGSVLERVGRGAPPRPDGGVSLFARPAGVAVAAVLGFTAHHVIAAEVDPDWLMTQLAGNTLAMPLTPRFLTLLGERIGAVPGGQDILLVTDGTGRGHSGSDPANPAALDHPRVTRALRYRDEVRAVTVDGGGVLLIGRGLAGRWEVSVEVDEAARGRGIGRGLLGRARDLVPVGELIWAQVHPANVASLRALLAAGYRPVGAEVLFTRPAAAAVQ